MRRFFERLIVLTVVVALPATLVAQTQAKRLVLVEEFTNTGCGPCATWSPVLDSCINYRLGDCIAIKYHSRFPYAADEFYNYDMNAHQAKVNYYNVTGVPATFIDGYELVDRSFDNLNKAISLCLEQPVKAVVSVRKELGSDHVLKAHVDVTPVADLDGSNLRLFVAAIEEHIETALPYPNGERELNYTMLKMLTGANGHQMGELLSSGQTFSYDGQWTADFCNNEKELGVVAFVQNTATREVLGTAYIGPEAEGENRIALNNLSATPDLICTPDYYGRVIFRNDGAGTVNSAILNVRVNGSVKQYPWKGSLAYLQRDTMNFDGFTNFMLVTSGRNKAELWFSNINGTESVSNTITKQFDNSVQVKYGAQLKVYTDKKPEETTWKLYNSAGDVVQEGGPYTDARKILTEDLHLTADDCYHLEFHDAGGDGIKGANGNGYYQLMQVDAMGKTVRVAQGDYTGAVYDVFFRLEGTQAKRPLVVFEEFTNTSCDPCAEFSPSFDEVIYRRMADMVPITYHYNFPSNRDPFYLANPEEAMTRANFYGISGVPTLFVMGQHARAHGYEELLDSYIDVFSTATEKVRVSTEALFDDNGELKVRASVLPLDVASGANLRLFVVAVEERVEWNEPAANGESSWNYVMRKMMPSANGEPLPKGLTQVTPLYYNYSWTPANYYDDKQLGLVTFVQDMDSRDVLGTCYTPLPTGDRRAAKIVQLLNVPDRICTPAYSAQVVVRNTGKATLNDATLNVSINGQVQSTPWTGTLHPLQIDTLQTPLFTGFPLYTDKANQVQIWLSELNGSLEESPRKDLSLTTAYSAANAVRLTVMTDQKPEEITWAVFNSADDVVDQGGPYTDARTKMVHNLQLGADDCYTLVLSDSGHDGITGNYGRGYFMLHEVTSDGKTRLLVQGDYTGSSHKVYFSLHDALATAVTSVAAEPQRAVSRRYDLQGRPANSRSHFVIENKKITISK